MAACGVTFVSPVTGETVQSKLWNEINNIVENVEDSNNVYSDTLSESFVKKFGNWFTGSYKLPVNQIGEPILSESVINQLGLQDRHFSLSEAKVKQFITNTGFNLTYDDLKNRLGSPRGIIDFYKKTVELDIHKSDFSTLSEEAMHIYVKVLQQNNPVLYKSLLLDVQEKYKDVFEEVRDEYKDVYESYDDIMEETIVKILNQRLIEGKDFGVTKNQRIDSWFRKALSFLKDLLGVSKEQFNDFFGTALGDFVSNIDKVYEIEATDKRFYQKDNVINAKQKSIVDKIRAEELSATMIDGKRKYKDARTGDILDTVHDVIEKSKPAGLVISPQLKKKAEQARDFGTAGHEDITNIITRELEKMKPNAKLTEKTEKLGSDIYNQLEGYFGNWVAEKLAIDPNGVFIMEQPIRDNKNGGTPDLLFIQTNGITHIHDWKFVSFETTEKGKVKEDTVKAGRRNEWYIQMNKYKEMLTKRYGVTQFAETRFKPIAAFYEQDANKDYFLAKIEIGDDKAYLRDIPLEDEKTGSASLDALIKRSLEQRKSLRDKTFPNKEEYNKAQETINSITNYVFKLQRDKDNKSLISYIKGKIKDSKQILADKTEGDDKFAQVLQFTQFFKAVERYYLNDIDTESDTYKIFEELSGEVKILNQQYLNKLSDFKQSNNIADIGYTVGWLQGKTMMLHQFKNDVFRYFNGLKEKAFNIIDKEAVTFNDEVKELIAQMKNEGNDFKDIVQENENNYSLVAQYNKEFFKQLDTADVKWLEKNIQIPDTIIVDNKEVNTRDEFDRAFSEKKDELYSKYTTEEAKQKFINWNYKYNVYEKDYKIEALKFYQRKGYHPYLKPIETWKNDKYVKLEANKDKAISKLYFKFVEINKRANAISDKHIRSNFLPMIEADLVENIVKNGIDVSKIKSSFLNDVKYVETDNNRLALKFTHHIDKKNVSLDLGAIYSQFAYNVFYNEEFGKLSDKALILENVLQTGDYYKTDGRGNIKTENGTPVVINYDNDSNEDKSEIQGTINVFNDFADKYLRNITNKTKDIDLFGFSGLKLLGKVQSGFSAVSLGFNPLSATVNLAGGMTNLHFLGFKGKHFTNGDVSSATMAITSANPKALKLMKLFDVSSTSSAYNKAKELSDSKFKLSKEVIYILQRKGEEFVQNSTLLAYMKHINKDGVPKKADEQSLYDLAINDKGEVDTAILTEPLYEEVRRKVRALNNEIMGSMSDRDYVTAQQYLGGRLLLHFRKWALPMTKARFGELGYNANLEEYEEGRYRQGLKLVIEGFRKREILPLIKDALTLSFNTPNEAMKSLYAKALEKTPDLNMEIEEFQEWYLRNMRATIGEFAVIMMLSGMLYALKGDDDDDETDSSYKALASKLIFRTAGELSFWTDYDSANRMIKSPIPLLGLLDKGSRLLSGIEKDLSGEEGHTLMNVIKLTPLNAVVHIPELFEEDKQQQ